MVKVRLKGGKLKLISVMWLSPVLSTQKVQLQYSRLALSSPNIGDLSKRKNEEERSVGPSLKSSVTITTTAQA